MNTRDSDSTEKILEGIYQVSESRYDEDFKIKNFNSRVGKIRYLDSQLSNKSIEDQSFSGGSIVSKRNASSMPKVSPKIFGGAEDNKSVSIYKSLPEAGIHYSEVKRFVETCNLYFLQSNMYSNSIFIIPDDDAIKAIQEDIKQRVGSGDPKSPENLRKLGQSPALYKSFILDVFGEDKSNGGFEYRIDKDYPSTVNTSILRRQSRNNDIYYVKLSKSGLEISLNEDMKNSESCKFICKIGKEPNFLSYLFLGNIPREKGTKKNEARKINKKRRITHKNAFKSRIYQNRNDREYGAYQFVADMAKTHGIGACVPYYSADMTGTSFALLNKFGVNEACDCDCCTNDECDAIHAELVAKYNPSMNAKLTNENFDIMRNFNKKCRSHDISSADYFGQVKKYYDKMTGGHADNNEIAADIARGIYNNTGDIDFACDTMQDVSNTISSDSMKGGALGNASSLSLNAIMSALDENVLGSAASRQYFPILYARKRKSKKSKSKSKKSKKRTTVVHDIDLEFGEDVEAEDKSVSSSPETSVAEEETHEEVPSEKFDMDDILDEM